MEAWIALLMGLLIGGAVGWLLGIETEYRATLRVHKRSMEQIKGLRDGAS